jgi:AcrR family transcriptional regulator
MSMYTRGMDAQTKLISTTQELLWERGYVATSPKAIQQRAGVGQGSMYHHFEGKSALCAAAVRQSGADLRAEVEPILSGPGGAIERIGAYLRRERDVLRGCRIGGLTQDPEVVADPQLREPIEETLSWLQTRLAEVLAEGQQSGELSENFSPSQTASMLCAVLQGGYVLARGENSVHPFSEATAGAMSLLDTLISSPAHPARRTEA